MSEPLAVREAPASYQVAQESQGVRPGYKQTEVGVIPADWVVKPIGLAFEICNNLRLPISQTVREKMIGEFPYYGPTNIQGYINEYRVEGEYALIGEDGDHFLKWRDQSMTLLVSGRFNVNNHAHLVRGTTNLTAWFYYYFSHRDLTSHLTRQGASRYKLTKNTLLGIPCALPPSKAEQEAIAEALSDADALIEALEQLIVKKRDLKQGTMQELLTGKKRLPGFSGEWEVKRLGDVIEKIVGGGTPSRSNPQYWGNEIPWVTVKDFATFDPRSAQEAITKTGLQHSASHLIPKDTLITSTRMALGKAVIYEVDVAINQDLKALFPKSVLATQFLYFWFQYHGQSIDELGSGSTVKGISLPDLKKIEFPLPLIPEQTAIATVLSDMDADLTAMEQQRDKTRALKQGMMQELLTGRIRLV